MKIGIEMKIGMGIGIGMRIRMVSSSNTVRGHSTIKEGIDK
jgi:hypothetical protein